MFISRWLSGPLAVVLLLSSYGLYWTNRTSRRVDSVIVVKQLSIHGSASNRSDQRENLHPFSDVDSKGNKNKTVFESVIGLKQGGSINGSASVINPFDNWPPLSDLITKGRNNQMTIIGNVQWLLDFAIVGHSKTGTTDLELWLSRHPEVQGYVSEVRSLYHHNPGELVEMMYNLSTGRRFKRGYKHPLDIVYDHSVDYLAKHWPRTGLIVGVRSPVKWMESWYNFRVRMRGRFFHGNGSASDPMSMRGLNLPFQMFFHRHLALLGKTNSNTDPRESVLLNTLSRQMFPKRPYVPNKIFLYDVSQPFDRNESRQDKFREDLQRFIGLRQPLKPIRIAKKSKNFHFALDICEERYVPLRKDIMKVSTAASKWISTYFINHPDVTVSSKEHFREILETWLHDPCDEIIQGAMPEGQALVPEGQSTQQTDLVVSSSDVGTIGYSNSSSWESLGRPALADLVENKSTLRSGANVEFLLDFGIVGHAKTATTSLLSWISAHKEVQMYNEEIHHLTFGRTGLFVTQLYSLQAGSQFRRGYKAPNDISIEEPRNLLRKYFPNVDLVIGLRHPVKWFESYYNYNTRRGIMRLKPAEAYAGWNNLPYQIKFHVHLAAMGKTRPSHPEEFALLKRYIRKESLTPQRMKHRVFLYDVSQPFDKNKTRNAIFREDLSKFLGLSSILEPIELRNHSMNFHYAIDICDEQYQQLRQDLIDFGKAASTWILKYFLDLPDVYVSSKDNFVKMLKTWDRDTCL